MRPTNHANHTNKRQPLNRRRTGDVCQSLAAKMLMSGTMKLLSLFFVLLLSITAFSMEPLMQREKAPQISAAKAIEIAATALAGKPGKYYCARATLQDQQMLPGPNGARHWEIVFHEEGRQRTVDAAGRETFGDMEVNVSISGEVFGTRQIISGPRPKN